MPLTIYLIKRKRFLGNVASMLKPVMVSYSRLAASFLVYLCIIMLEFRHDPFATLIKAIYSIGKPTEGLLLSKGLKLSLIHI